MKHAVNMCIFVFFRYCVLAIGMQEEQIESNPFSGLSP